MGFIVSFLLSSQPILLYVMEHTFLAPGEICSEIFGFGPTGCGDMPPHPPRQWNVTLPPTPKPPVAPFVQPDVSLNLILFRL